jgi:hypothetical protein
LLRAAQCIGCALLQAVGIITDVQPGDAGADGKAHAMGFEESAKSFADGFGPGDGLVGGYAR